MRLRRATLLPSPSSLLPLLLALSACQTTIESGTSRPPPPEPRAPPPTPQQELANSMALVLLTPKAADRNSNGRSDTIAVEVYLFAQPYPTPIIEAGTFVFAIFAPGTVGRPGATPIAQWTVPPPDAVRQVARSLAGPCFRIQLSLLDLPEVGESIPFASVDLVGRFEPNDGRAPIFAEGVRTIQMVGAAPVVEVEGG